MSLLNGDRPDAAEENRKNQDHGAAVNQAFQQEDSSTEYLKEVTDTELQPRTIEMLDNLLSKDFVLSNMSDAEVHEQRWIARIVKLMIEAQHPHHDSMWQGAFRQLATGREDAYLSALSESQKTEILEVVQGFIARVARSREGWQQEEISKSYAVSERREDDEESGWMNS
jgi:hypothetical protein